MTAQPEARRNQERRENEPDNVEAFIRQAVLMLANAGVVRSPSWVSRTVRTFFQSTIDGLPFGNFLALRVQLSDRQRRRMEVEHPDLYNRLSYSDPTGETAMRRVDYERCRKAIA